MNAPDYEKYRELNSMAHKNGIVFLGGNYFSDMPICELSQTFNLNENVYNRSVSGTNINEVGKLLDGCVFDLAPEKVFVNLGDEDIKDPQLDVDEFISKYEWILYTIHSRTNADIYIISVLSSSPKAKEINSRLKKLARNIGCSYIDVTRALTCEKRHLVIFDILKIHLLLNPISFSEAMNNVCVEY